MNDDKTKPGESSRPSHEAAKVVIPFDIDISAIESKLGEIERRVSVITSSRQPQESQQDPSQQKTPDDMPDWRNQPTQQKTPDDMPDWRNQPMSYTSPSRSDSSSPLEDNENQAVMLATMIRMTDLLRQINDTVILMYSQMMSGRNNA